MAPTTSFKVDTQPHDDPGQALVVGLAAPGVGGLTAVDYLVRQLAVEEIGYVTPDALPAITPVEAGTPRNHTRLYNLVDVDLSVLVGELFVPTWAARSFADALLEWVATADIEEIVVLHAVPYPHDHSAHAAFYVATDEYRKRRLDGTDIQPLQGGVLDGVAGELMSRSLAGTAPPVGVYITPVHPPGPDIDASLYLLDALESVYGVSLDLTELEDLSDEIHQYYATLSERLAALEDADESADSREFAYDRMYM